MTSGRALSARHQALESDAMHHATLRLAAGKLPQGYVNEAMRARIDGYHADAEGRERLVEGSDRWVEAATRDAGDLAEARRRYEDNAQDGMQFAMIRRLRSGGEIEAYRIGNPMFRDRFDHDMAFQHGVKAGVWANRE